MDRPAQDILPRHAVRSWPTRSSRQRPVSTSAVHVAVGLSAPRRRRRAVRARRGSRGSPDQWGLVNVRQSTWIRYYADSSRARFHCFATAHQAIAARVPIVVRPEREARSDHVSGLRSAGRRTSARWSPAHGAHRAESPIAVLQVMSRSPSSRRLDECPVRAPLVLAGKREQAAFARSTQRPRYHHADIKSASRIDQ